MGYHFGTVERRLFLTMSPRNLLTIPNDHLPLVRQTLTSLKEMMQQKESLRKHWRLLRIPAKFRFIIPTTKKTGDLLHFATHETNVQAADINYLLSQPSKDQLTSATHELIHDRSDYTPEVYTHELCDDEYYAALLADQATDDPFALKDDDLYDDGTNMGHDIDQEIDLLLLEERLPSSDDDHDPEEVDPFAIMAAEDAVTDEFTTSRTSTCSDPPRRYPP